MKNILHFSRALKIIYVFSRRGILSKIAENNLVSPRALFFINIVNFFIGKEIANSLVGSTIVDILKNLGPAFVKLGQALATRPDIVGVELANELTQLHDKMEPFSFKKIEQSIMAETGKKDKRSF
jgi:ubiquinone biosynthesis protein